MHGPSQALSLGLSVAGIALALLRRRIQQEGDEYWLSTWPKLVRFPIFWVGLAVVVYCVIQAINPSWRYQQNGKVWWLVPIREIRWLPTGIDAPFAEFNAWRQVIIYADAWLLVCSIWVGVTRRRSLRILLGVLMGNAALLWVLLDYQRLTGNERIPWPLTDWTRQALTASFIYSNHAGAFFALVAFTAVALATWHFDHGARLLLKSTPAGVFALATLFLVAAVIFTFSRGATLTVGLALAIFAVWFVLRLRLRPTPDRRSLAGMAVVLVVFLVFILNAVRYLDFSHVNERFDRMATQQLNDANLRSRMLAHEAAAGMLGDHWLRGVGAGGFRYLFPGYVRRYPEIYKNGGLFWEHAHCDWLEIPIELGLWGDLLLLGGAGWWAWFFSRHGALWHPAAMPLLFGCLQTVVHAAFDFPFQCPAILGTWCAMVTMAGKWVEIDGG